MNREHRVKSEMFGRVTSFWNANRNGFPEESEGGKRFGQLATIVDQLDAEFVRSDLARATGRRVKQLTRDAAMEYMREIASTGRRAAFAETGPHPFRMPERRAATVVLTAARLFMAEAEKRKERFISLGMPATFLTDFGKVVNELADAVAVQQGSRAARKLANGAIEAALEAGMVLVADLDVTVQNTLRGNSAKRAEWSGARRMDNPWRAPTAKADTPKVPTASGTPAVSEIATSDPAPATGKEGEVKVAS